MLRTIARRNIQDFEQLLARERDPHWREVLNLLIESERENLGESETEAERTPELA